MKVHILQENLNKGVGVLAKICASSGKLPILSHILFMAKPEGLWLSATDLELSVTLKLGAKVEKEGAVAVPARILTEFLASLEVGKLTITTDGEQMQLTSGAHTAKFSGMGAKEFPNIPTETNEKLFAFEGGFDDVAQSVCLAAASDESRPVLTGVLCTLIDKELRMVATDGYRLSMRTVGVIKKEKGKGAEVKKWVVPARTLMEVASLIKGLKYDENVQVGETKDGNQLVFLIGEAVVVSRLVADEFPNVEQIIPKVGETCVEVDQEELLTAVKMAAIFARESANIIKMAIKNGQMTITANSPQIGENESKIEANISGPDGIIAFNSRYLLDILTTIKGREGKVKLQINGALAPGLLTFSGIDNFIYVVMPVRVQEEQKESS